MFLRTRQRLRTAAVVIVVAFGATSSAADMSTARKAEQEAKARIEQKDYCGAAQRFLEANQAAPHADYLFNAALAAQDGGDAVWAQRLFRRANAATKGDDRQLAAFLAAANKRVKASLGEHCERDVSTLSVQDQQDLLANMQTRLMKLEQSNTKGGEQAAAFDIPRRNSATMGATNGDIDVVVFTDYQCPFCARVHPLMKELTTDPQTGDRVTVVYKQFPLAFHKQAEPAALAALAAREQGEAFFWAFSEKLFEHQRALGPEKYSQIAQEVGLDLGRFERDLRRNKGRYADEVNRDKADGANARVRGTPTIFVNGWALKERTVAGVMKLAAEHAAPNSAQLPRYRAVHVKARGR